MEARELFEFAVVERKLFDYARDYAIALRVRIDGKIARIDAVDLNLAAQNARAHRVKRRNPHPVRAGNALDALFHLVRRLVGERDCQDVVRIDMLFADQIGDAIGQHPCLAAARACEHQHRPLGVQHRFELFFVEKFGIIHIPILAYARDKFNLLPPLLHVKLPPQSSPFEQSLP